MALSGSGTITKSFSVPWPLRKAIGEVFTRQSYGGALTRGRPAGARRWPPSGRRAVAAQRSRATRQTASATSDAADAHVQGDDPPVGALAGASAGQPRPGVADPAGGHHAPARGAAADEQSEHGHDRSAVAELEGEGEGEHQRAERRRASRSGRAARSCSRRWGRSSTSTSPPSETAPTEPSSGPSGLRPEAPSTAEPSADEVASADARGVVRAFRGVPLRGASGVAEPCSVGTGARRRPAILALCREGRPPSPRALPTRTPLVDRSLMMARATRAAMTGGASRCHHVIRL